MHRLALLSFHGCPVARLGEKDTGGMNVYVLQLAREFGRRGHLVDVYTRCHDPTDPTIVELGDGARVIHLKAGPYSTAKDSYYEHIPEFLGNLCSYQASEDLEYDLIHSHYWLSGRVGMILGRKWRVPHVVTFHTLAKTKMRARAGEKETDLRIRVEERVARGADGVIVSTEQEKQDLISLYRTPGGKVRVIPAGVDLEMFKPIDRNAARNDLGIDGKKVILYVGRIEPIKGLGNLLEAVALLEDQDDTVLLIVGGKPGDDSELEHLKAQARELGIGDRVVFTGAVPQCRLPSYYSAADVFVLPSYTESFGLAALEAMACGTPVVASRVGGLSTFIRNGETGYLIPWRCPEPFAQRLDMLLANPPLRDTLGAAARAKALEMSWRGVADHMLDHYSFLMGETLESVAGA
ncbi:MAG: glycosyltransferase [Chloroflexi bacterium]|nr:glycosyltransferase [Chloroflexota bacterium]